MRFINKQAAGAVIIATFLVVASSFVSQGSPEVQDVASHAQFDAKEIVYEVWDGAWKEVLASGFYITENGSVVFHDANMRPVNALAPGAWEAVRLRK